MIRLLIISTTLFVLTIFLAGFSVVKVNPRDEWKIETVTLEGDTLYHNENIQFTIDFYNAHMLSKDASSQDIRYVTKCMHSTFIELKNVRLKLKGTSFSQSAIIPCWYQINFPSIVDGTYTSNSDSLQLLNADNSVFMELISGNGGNHLIYSDSTYNYQIIYAKSGN